MVALSAWIGGSDPAAAMGGFGRGGGFGRPGFGMGFGPRRPIIPPRRSSGRVVEPGRGPGHHRIGGSGGGTDPGPVISGQRTGGGGGGNSSSGVPPQGERRFVPDEVITEISPAATPQSIGEIARRYDLTQLEVQRLPLIGATFYRWRLSGRRSVADTVGALEDERIVMSAQPNYIFTLQEAVTKSASGTQGDAAQYVLEKLQIDRAHQIATGKNVLIAVIDSEIDANNPNLEHSIVKSFNALSGGSAPHQHGTAMAGAIAAHGKLMGIAPGAALLAARAFDGTQGEAKGMSFAIYKSLQWAADNAVRIVNMSFAGPADPALHRMLAAAHEKNVVLIAAAGNAGPNSAPLYPAADQAVIAVTATDSDDGVFKMANRGAYVAAAAPGVDVLALAPGESYQITTGTSVAAAHVSGLAALLLECKPSLKPDEVRTIITTTATPFGSASPHAESGAGLVNAYRALLSLNAKAGDEGDAQAKR